MNKSFININTIKYLNLSAKFPLPLFKMIIANRVQKAKGNKPNLSNQQLVQICICERVQMTPEEISQTLSTLEAIFRIALIKQYTLKAVSSLFKDNTLLQQKYIDSVLQEFKNAQESTNIVQMSPKLNQLSKMNWNIFNCKTDDKGMGVNKMYVKIELVFQRQEQCGVFFMTLPEFKIFIEEIRILGSNITK